jgi:hypothetical protein
MKLFTKHPADVGMSYIEHLQFALKLSLTLLLCSITSAIHAIFPFLWINRASSKIDEMNKNFKHRNEEIKTD